MKIMVLGGGSCQINLINRLKELGDEVVLIDYLPDCPASELCDTHLLISTFDENAVLAAAKEHDIQAIITLGTDQPILTASKIAQKLGLPFYVTHKQALSATNKRIMKPMFVEHDIPTVNFKLITRDFCDDDISGISFPAVLKPVDSQGQRGIYKINTIDEIRKYLPSTLSFSRENTALIEEYYPSDEITVNGWLCEGVLHLLSVVDRVTMTRENHIGVCVAHNFPSLHLYDKYVDIERLTEKIVEVFGFRNGPVYFQYLIGDEGIKVNEIAMRIGGAYEDVTIPIISGVDIAKMLIDISKGHRNECEQLNSYFLKSNKKHISTQMFFLKCGKVTKVEYDEKEMGKFNIHKIQVDKKEGYLAKSIENATSRAGYFIVSGKSSEELSQNIDKAYDAIKIEDENGNNMVIRYSEYEDRYKFVKAKNNFL